MSFNRKYLEAALNKSHGFTVEKDGTGMAWCAYLTVGEDTTRLSGPHTERIAALHCGILKLLEMYRSERDSAIRDMMRAESAIDGAADFAAANK